MLARQCNQCTCLTPNIRVLIRPVRIHHLREHGENACIGMQFDTSRGDEDTIACKQKLRVLEYVARTRRLKEKQPLLVPSY